MRGQYPWQDDQAIPGRYADDARPGPQRKEDGFQLLHEHVTQHADELIAEFGQEQNDHGLRCWLLELIGETKSESAFSLLAAQLHSPDEAFRRWAVTGLENLGTKSARQALYQARSNGEIPDYSDDRRSAGLKSSARPRSAKRAADVPEITTTRGPESMTKPLYSSSTYRRFGLSRVLASQLGRVLITLAALRIVTMLTKRYTFPVMGECWEPSRGLRAVMAAHLVFSVGFCYVIMRFFFPHVFLLPVVIAAAMLAVCCCAAPLRVLLDHSAGELVITIFRTELVSLARVKSVKELPFGFKVKTTRSGSNSAARAGTFDC